MNVIRGEMQKEETEWVFGCHLEPNTMSDIGVPDFKTRSRLSFYITALGTTESSHGENHQFSSSNEELRKREVCGLLAVAFLVSGGTEIRTPNS